MYRVLNSRLEQVQGKVIKMIRVLENMIYKGRLKKLGLLSLQRRKLSCLQLPDGEGREKTEPDFSEMPSAMGGNKGNSY